MHLRSLIVLGLLTAFGTATAVQAQEAPAKTFLFSKTVKAADDDQPPAKRKKLTAKEQAKAKKAEDAKAKKEADAKAKKEAADKAKLALIEKKKELMRLAAKQRADEAVQARTDALEAARKAKIAKAQAREDALASARARAAEPQEPVALARGTPVIGMTAERVAAQRAAAVGADQVIRSGNNGELRSGDVASRPSGGFFQILFGDEPAPSSRYSMLPETQALDAVLDKKKKFRVNPMYEPQSVPFSGYPRGTIVIDTGAHFLYLVEGLGSARRYGIAVGREGLQYKGSVAVGDKQEWPRWIPTKEMQQREPKKYGRYKDGMPGGGQNPLGARAIYLYQGKQDTHLRIHGTIAPESIGTNASNGCFRMINDHVIDLYNRVRVGTPVVVL